MTIEDNELLEKLTTRMAYEDMPMIVQNEITRRSGRHSQMAEAALNRIYSGKEGMTEALEEEGALQLGHSSAALNPAGVVMVAPCSDCSEPSMA